MVVAVHSLASLVVYCILPLMQSKCASAPPASPRDGIAHE